MHKRWFAIRNILVLGFIFALATQNLALAAQPKQGSENQQVFLPLVQQNSDGQDVPPAEDPQWLAYVNELRAIGGLPPLQNNPSWSLGCLNHARYMVLNDTITHSENPANYWYTIEGHIAGLTGNLVASNDISMTDQMAVNLWMTSPFHGINILDSALTATGFGSYRLDAGIWRMGACLNVLQGIRNKSTSGMNYPIIWPSNGSTMPFLSYEGDETPDPLASCPGYQAPSGPPIYLQMGMGDQVPAVNYQYHYLVEDGKIIDHCVFDETSYTNPDSKDQEEGRRILNYRDAIIMIPRQPLNPGSRYTVYLLVNHTWYIWSFFTEEAGPSLPPQAFSLVP
jgi:uncharacterized protein YkwD